MIGAEIEVDERHVGPFVHGRGDGLRGVAGVGDDDEVGLRLEQGSCAVPQDGVVIEQQDPDHDASRAFGATGTSAAMTVPWPGEDSIVKVPPRLSMRHAIARSP